MRRRLFGRHGSSSSKADSLPTSRHSKEGVSSPPPAHSTKEKEKGKDKEKEKGKGKDKEKEKEKEEKDSSSMGSRGGRPRKSLDDGVSSSGKSGGGDRLSIFGTSFSGSLGKSRKPPPRYSTSYVQFFSSEFCGVVESYTFLSGSEERGSAERTSVFSVSRLHNGGGGRRSFSTRPSTPKWPSSHKENKEKAKTKPTPTASISEKDTREPTVLRKRTSSAPAPPMSGHANSNGVGIPLEEGKGMLEQIGKPDHSGWMRKKGERYNTWKSRYLVLKGDHIYWLKSSHKAVRWFLSYMSSYVC